MLGRRSNRPAHNFASLSAAWPCGSPATRKLADDDAAGCLRCAMCSGAICRLTRWPLSAAGTSCAHPSPADSVSSGRTRPADWPRPRRSRWPCSSASRGHEQERRAWAGSALLRGAGTGGFALVDDGGHEPVGAAEVVERWAHPREVVHQRLENPTGPALMTISGLGRSLARRVAAATTCELTEDLATSTTTPRGHGSPVEPTRRHRPVGTHAARPVTPAAVRQLLALPGR